MVFNSIFNIHYSIFNIQHSLLTADKAECPQWQQFLDGKVTGISPHLSSPVGEGMVCLQLPPKNHHDTKSSL